MSDSIADDILRNGYDRWLRLEEAKAEVSDDIKELMAELKGHGFTPKAVRESFRRVRNADNADQQEHDAIVDLYVASLTGARPAPAHEKTLNNFRSYAEEKGRGEGNQTQMDRATEGSLETGSVAAENARKAASTIEEHGSVSHAGAGESPATNSEDEPFEPVAFLRQPKPLRPDCLNPDNCGGYGPNTCHSCKVAAASRETVGA